MAPKHLALVTGGSRGIGTAIALELARAGAAVFVAARDGQACRVVAERIRRDGGTAWPLSMDVTDAESIRGAFVQVHELAGRLGDVAWLVNNAGVAASAPLVPKRAGEAELAAELVDVNFHGPRRMVQACLPAMKTAGYGRIVNLASSAGLRGYAYVSAYCASKFAVVGYTLAGAEELAGTGVTMNAVCPHYVESAMLERSVARIVERTKRSPEAVREFLKQDNPGGRFVTQEEVAEAVRDLVLGDSNGVLIELDGSSARRVLHPTDEHRGQHPSLPVPR
jgi:NAD(P)-dependent dehydrogenase (short-subunit alcohol dehydrogenase family)